MSSIEGVRGEELQAFRKIEEVLRDNLSKAEAIAATYGYTVGKIYPLEPVRASEGKVVCWCEIPPNRLFEGEWFIQWLCSERSYLGAVDIKSLYIFLLRVVEIRRETLSSAIEVKPAISIPTKTDIAELITPLKLCLEPILFLRDPEREEPMTINYALDQHSPVFIPRADFLERFLGFPRREESGVVIGCLSNIDVPIRVLESAEGTFTSPKVSLPMKALFQHTLIVGTTGAGKTTILKNLIYELVENHKACVVAFDPAQELVQMMLPSRRKGEEEVQLKRILYGKEGERIGKVNILLPVTTRFVEENKINSFDDLAESYAKDVLCPLFKMHNIDVNCVNKNTRKYNEVEVIEFKHGEELLCRLIPFALKVSFKNIEELAEKLNKMNPFFTEQARALLPYVLMISLREEFKPQEPKPPKICDLQKLIQKIRYSSKTLTDELRIDNRTLDNIIRNLLVIHEWGILNVKIGTSILSEPTPDLYIEGGALTVVDLYAVRDIQAESVFIMHLLDEIFRWKKIKRRGGEKTPAVFVAIDEAHNYFHREAEREAMRRVADKIQRIAREGRKERLGLILSTQFPRDVHEVVRGLCNTKIILRVDPNDVEVLDVPREYRDIVTRMRDLTALVKSPVGLRLGYVTMRASPPLTEHVDLSSERPI